MFCVAAITIFFIAVGMKIDDINHEKHVQEIRTELTRSELVKKYESVVEDIWAQGDSFEVTDEYLEYKEEFFIAMAKMEIEKKKKYSWIFIEP